MKRPAEKQPAPDINALYGRLFSFLAAVGCTAVAAALRFLAAAFCLFAATFLLVAVCTLLLAAALCFLAAAFLLVAALGLLLAAGVLTFCLLIVAA